MIFQFCNLNFSFRSALPFGFVFCWIISQAKAQIPFDTMGNRFLKNIFPEIKTDTQVVYASGINALGQVQLLHLDVYEPAGDTASLRPLIILAHGGGFIQGDKQDMAFTCQQFAKKGYVTATIQYRLGLSGFSTQALVQMVIRASQDMKNAIRFFRKSASQANPYRIDPNFIFSGGFSAGAITALHAAFLDKVSEIPANQGIPNLDSLHNNSQYPDFSWKTKAILNIAGALGDTLWMEYGDIPVASFHGTTDNVVPFESGSIGLPGFSVAMFGSSSIQSRSQNLGIASVLRAFPGAGHDYTSGNPDFADTTEIRVARFLYPFLLEPITKTQKARWKSDFQIFKRTEYWQIEWKDCRPNALTIFDLQGKILHRIFPKPENKIKLPTKNQARILVLEFENGEKEGRILPGE